MIADIVEQYRPMVLALSRPYRYRHDYDDIVASGMLGLIKAANKHDGRANGTGGARLIYAYIRGYILKYRNRMSDVVSRPYTGEDVVSTCDIDLLPDSVAASDDDHVKDLARRDYLQELRSALEKAIPVSQRHDIKSAMQYASAYRRLLRRNQELQRLWEES
jgi:hypothetical protein